MKPLSAFFLSLALSLTAFPANLIKTPTTFTGGSSLTIQTGVVVTFSPGSIVNFTGATVTGLPSATGATIQNTGSILKGDGAGGGIAADATFIDGVINSTVAPIFSNISARPTTLSGFGITDAQPLNGDLTALAGLGGNNVIYYRSAPNTWLPVTIGTNLTFTGGTLNATGGGSGGGGDALIANGLSQFASTSSLQLAGVISNETGLGALVFGTSPIFTTDITTPKIIWSGTVTDTSGPGSPEGVVTAGIGSTYRRTDGGPTSTFYFKQSGIFDTGWVPAVPATATDINSIINSTVAPVFDNISRKPGTAAGYNILNGGTLDLWAAKSSNAPVFSISVTSPKNIFTANVIDTFGTGSPQGVVTADVGSTYRRTDGGVGTTLYRKETGTGNTGWVTGGGAIPATSAILKGDTVGNAAPASASDINSVINSSVSPVFVNVTSKPTTAAGYSITNGATIDLWGAISSTAPTFTTSVTTPLLNAAANLALTAGGMITLTPGPSNVIAIKQFVIADPADPSKRVQEVVSSVASGVTRSNFHPDADTSAVVSNQTAPAGQWFNGFANGTFSSLPVVATDIVPNEFTVGNSDTSVPDTGAIDTVKLDTPLTGLHTFPFPSAGNYSPGETVRFYSSVDSGGNIARVTTAAGVSDTFNGQSSIDISDPYFSRVFVSDGLTPGNWTVSLARNFSPGFRAITPSGGNTYTLVPDTNSAKQNASLFLATGANNLLVPTPFAGMEIELILQQPSGGNGTLVLPVGSRTAGGTAGLVTLTGTSNAVDRLKGIYYGKGGYFLWDAPILNETSAALPAAPSGLGTTVISASQVNLAWTDNATTETGYLVERAPGLNATTGFIQIGSVLPPGTAAYSDFSTTGSTSYTYRVRAQNTGGYSGYSTANATTSAGAPTADLLEWHFNEGGTRTDVSGTGTTPGGTMTAYPAWTSSTQSGTGFAFNPLAGLGITTLTVTPAAAAGTISYTYKVAAFKSDGTHNGASAVTVTSNANLDSTNFNRISWIAVTGANYYEVYRTSVGAGSNSSTIGRLPPTGNTFTDLTLDDTGLVAGGSATIPSTLGTPTNLYITTANSPVVYGNNVLTDSFWVNDAFSGSVTDIINGGNNAFRIQRLNGSGNRIQIQMPGTSGTALWGNFSMTGFTGGWHLVTIVMDQVTAGAGAPTGSFAVYLDGNTATPRTVTYTILTHAGSPNFVTGTPQVGSSFWAGPIDDERIYGRALNATEIGALYTNGAQ